MTDYTEFTLAEIDEEAGAAAPGDFALPLTPEDADDEEVG